MGVAGKKDGQRSCQVESYTANEASTWCHSFISGKY